MTRRIAIGAALAALVRPIPIRRDVGKDPRVGDRAFGPDGRWLKIVEVWSDPSIPDFAHITIATQVGLREVFRDEWEARWNATLPYIVRIELAEERA